MTDKTSNKMSAAIKTLWHRSATKDSLKVFARKLARDKDVALLAAVAESWFDNKRPDQKKSKLKIKKVRKGKGVWEAQAKK